MCKLNNKNRRERMKEGDSKAKDRDSESAIRSNVQVSYMKYFTKRNIVLINASVYLQELVSEG
jgi:hypothetical protein